MDYSLSTLIDYISLGEIGLPNIQRPFVWKNVKVRDLFDSMYRGYPVGYLLLWKNEITDSSKRIGEDRKQKPPKLVIVDGQQRLTSLYAVLKGVPVVRENYEKERIYISFNPLEERFEVTDAAIRKDKSYIPDISVIWDAHTDIFEVVDHYFTKFGEVSDNDRRKIRSSFTNLQSLQNFPFTTLELAADISEEDVSEVFVRINSKGTPLNQADFILTLMSVFWDDGRKELELFCHDARIPSKGSPSPFNYYFEPDPDQLLRACVGVAFKRARLQYVYSILRGKDLDTEQFSEERRIQQFSILKNAQNRVLNVQYWHDFMNCLRQAGFKSGKMITSKNNMLFSYMLYIIGRTEYKVDEFDLRRVIARWFFMSSLTGRFTSSPESAMEFDLARFREIDEGQDYLDILLNICNFTLTNDYWNVRLPIDLATSSSRSPSLYAYYASLVLLDAPALFSKIKVSDLLDPALKAKQSGVERHHLFPKAYLKKIGIRSTRDINQIANYALVEWGDNHKISNKAPIDYLPKLSSRFNVDELSQMYYYHALPEHWEQLEYRDFLQQRRALIAQVIRDGYKTLIVDSDKEYTIKPLNISNIIESGESEAIEFKSTLRINLHTDKKDQRMELSALKTIAGFLNTNGGTLVIGITDEGKPIGIEADKFTNEDKMNLHLINIVKDRIGVQAVTCIHTHFEDYKNSRVMMIRCKKSPSAVFVKEENIEKFYIRTGPSTTELTSSQTQNYISQRFKH